MKNQRPKKCIRTAISARKTNRPCATLQDVAIRYLVRMELALKLKKPRIAQNQEAWKCTNRPWSSS